MYVVSLERSSDRGFGSGGLLGYPVFLEMYVVGLGTNGAGFVTGGFSAASVIDMLSSLYREDDAICSDGAV